MVTKAIGTVATSLAGQSRKDKAQRPARVSKTDLIARSQDLKVAKLALKNAREERLHEILTSPEVLGYLMAIGGIFISNKIPFSENEKENDLLQGIATTASVAMGLGHAGVGDLTSLSVAVGAGGASVLGSLVEGGSNLLNPFTWKWPLGPIWNW